MKQSILPLPIGIEYLVQFYQGCAYDTAHGESNINKFQAVRTQIYMSVIKSPHYNLTHIAAANQTAVLWRSELLEIGLKIPVLEH